ncbi:unnamed protein product [Brugia timori]|uniref:Uncharacterized protein n=1 Tax=Brugia timori TaxID=42155 RepID=A0A0R3RA47_9BILA|nr:unnamed protein product [Brugia timori]
MVPEYERHQMTGIKGWAEPLQIKIIILQNEQLIEELKNIF